MPGLKLIEWKHRQLERYLIDVSLTPSHECEFVLARLHDEAYALLEKVFIMWEKEELKGQKRVTTKKTSKKKMSASTEGSLYLAREELKSTYFVGLGTLDKKNKETLLSGVIDQTWSLPEMKVQMTMMKELADVKTLFCQVAGKSSWEEVMRMGSLRSHKVSDSELSKWKNDVRKFFAQKRKRTKLPGDEELEDDFLSVTDGGQKWPAQFADFVKKCTTSNLYSEDIATKMWKKMSEEDLSKLQSKLSWFDGRNLGLKLKDDTVVTEKMAYMVINANSCDRSWKEKFECQKLKKAKLEKLSSACEYFKKEDVLKKDLFCYGGDSGESIISEEMVKSKFSEDDLLIERSEEDEAGKMML